MVKKLIGVEEEKGLIDVILNYASEHRFTKSNISEAVEKAMQYMDDNATLGEIPVYEESLTREN